MKLQRFRNLAGGLIDRDELIEFTFDGRPYFGYRGDTLASALLAHGVRLFGRSFKYHRPRGVMAAGAEEPNALVTVGEGARAEPNLRATQVELEPGMTARSQNRWPSLAFDLGAAAGLASPLFPSGFYYKTFMWPSAPAGWLFYERFIRRAAGLGRGPVVPDPDRYDKTHDFCDVLVVGGGPAGLAAALAASRAGARTMLVEDGPRIGGVHPSGSVSSSKGGPSSRGWARWKPGSGRIPGRRSSPGRPRSATTTRTSSRLRNGSPEIPVSACGWYGPARSCSRPAPTNAQ